MYRVSGTPFSFKRLMRALALKKMWLEWVNWNHLELFSRAKQSFKLTIYYIKLYSTTRSFLPHADPIWGQYAIQIVAFRMEHANLNPSFSGLCFYSLSGCWFWGLLKAKLGQGHIEFSPTFYIFRTYTKSVVACGRNKSEIQITGLVDYHRDHFNSARLCHIPTTQYWHLLGTVIQSTPNITKFLYGTCRRRDLPNYLDY